MSQIDILRPSDMQDTQAVPAAPFSAGAVDTHSRGVLDFSFLEQTHSSAQGQPPQPVAAVELQSAQELDFSFLERPADDAAIAAQNVTYANQFTRQEVVTAGRHAKALGISVQEALRYADSAKSLARQADVDFMRQLSPRLVNALQGDAAYAAKDDIDALNALSIAFDDHTLGSDDMVVGAEIRQYRHSFGERTAKRLEEGAQQMGDSLRNAVLGIIEGFAASSRKDAESSVVMANAIDDDPVQAFVEGLAKRIRQKGEDMQQERAPRLAPADSAVQRYYENVITMAPQVLSQVATSIYGGPILSMAMMGAQITGSKYAELTQKGVDADKALYASVLSAVGQAPLEQLGLDKAMAIFKTSGAWNTAKALFGSAMTEGLTEFAQAYPDAIASIWAETSQKGGTFEQGLQDFVDQFGQITLDGLYEGAVAAPYGLLFGGLGMARNGKAPQNNSDLPLPAPILEALKQETEQALRMNQRQDFSTTLYQAAGAADAASLKQQDPEALREVVEELLPEQFAKGWLGVDDVQALYQSAQASGDTDNLLSVMGTDAQSLEASLAKGAPLPVSTAAVLVQASPANRQGLMDALRVSPDGPSGTEAKNFDPTARLETTLAEMRSSQKVHSEVQREVTRLKNEMIATGEPAHVAESFAALHASQALAFHTAYGVDPVQLLARRSVMRDDGDTVQQPVQGLYQPINAGVDLDAPVQVVTVQPRFAGKKLWEIMKGAIPAKLKKELAGSYKNINTGWDISLSSRGIGHAISSASSRGSGGIPHMEAVANLPSLIQHAVLVESHKDSKDKGLKAVHRMYAPMQEGQHIYAVKLTVKEYPKAMVAEIEDVRKVYDLSLEAEISKDLFVTPPDTTSGAVVGSVLPTLDISEEHSSSLMPLSPTPEKGLAKAANLHSSEVPTVTALKDPVGGVERPSMGIFTYSLRQLLADVKDNDGNSFYQTDEQNTKRGKTVFTSDGRAEVRIFKLKNLSTIPHESMHIFLDDLMTVAQDDGSLALAEAQRRIQVIIADASLPLRQSVAELSTAIAQVPPEGRMQALRQAAVELSQWAADATASAKTAADSVQAMQEESPQTGNPVAFPPWAELETQAKQFKREASHYSRVHTALKAAMAHMQGLEKARSDLQSLRDWAQVPQDADLHPKSAHYVPFHEAVAKGFEQYLMEGVAPSTKLRDVFSRIRGWILDVYKSARDVLGIPITDDVRAVFDRMLATDKQMQANRQLQNTLKREDAFLESGQISYEEWQDLQDLRNQAEMEVQATMDRATLRDRATRRRKAFSEAKQFLADDPFWQMVANISARTKDPANPAAPMRGGISKESVARLIGVENTVELARRRKGLINAKGEGMPLDLVAKEHGYEDEDAFINILYDRLVTRGETITKLANEIADQALHDADAEAEATGLEAGGQAYAAYLDKVDEVILGMLARKGYKTEREQQRFVYNSITPRTRIRQMAADELQFTPLRDIQPERYHAMLGAALKERQKALVKGDVMQALNAVEKARTANEMISLSRTILQQREDIENRAARMAQSKQGTFPTVYREAMRKVLQQYNLGNMRGLPEPEFSQANLEQIMLQTQGEDVAGVLPSFAPWILKNLDPNTGKAMLQHGKGLDYRLLTPSQLRDVDNILRYLQKTGYDARTDLKNAEAAKVKLLVGQAVEAMAPLADESLAPPDTARRAVQDSLRGLAADVDALRWQVRKADGFSNLMGDGTKGAMEEAILDKVLDGETRARARLDSLSTAMAPALTRLAASVRTWEKQHGKNLALKDRNGKLVELPKALQKAYGRKSWTADMVIALAFNVGNQSNIDRITSFYEDLDVFTVETLLGGQVAARIFAEQGKQQADPRVQGLFSLQDWQDIQNIWDAIASQWADTQAVHERMFGFTPQGVEATPLVLTDAQGQKLEVRGGYYPVRYDPKVSDRVAQWGEQEEILSRSESMFAVPSAKRGHTKAREENTPELPLRFDTGVLMEHITDAVRYIELAEITRYADKVTQAPAFRHQYERVYGKRDYDAIRPNLRGLVRQEPPPKMEIARLANAVRKYLVPFGLAWNFKVAALQLTAVFPAMGDIGATHVLAGVGHIASHGMPAVQAVWDASPYMLSRKDNIDQDLQRNMANFDPAKRPANITIAGKELSWEKFVEAGMLPIVAVDTVATTSVWMGAYTQKLSELQGQKLKTAIDSSSAYHDQAAQYADTIVKQSNPDYDASSRSSFLRAQGMNRLVNMFSSATTLFAQRHKYMYTAHAKGQITKLQLARFEMFDTIIPATAVAMMLALARGMWPNDDDDENAGLFKFLLASIFDFTAMRLPVFGSIVSDGVMALAGIDDGLPQRGNLRTALDAPIQLFGTVTGRAGRAIYSEEINDDQAKRLVYAVGDIASFVARVPVAKIARNAERGYDQWQRGEGTPLSIILPRPGK